MNTQFTQPDKIVSVQTNKQAIARDFGLKANQVSYISVPVDISSYAVLYEKSSQTSWFRGNATGTPLEWTIANSVMTLITTVGTFFLKQAVPLNVVDFDSLMSDPNQVVNHPAWQISRWKDQQDVRGWGVVMDGQTDNTTALKAAIAANNKLYFPPGVCRITGEIVIDKICHLFGSGVGVTVVYTDSPTANGLVFDLNYKQGGGLQNMSIASKSLTSDEQHVGSAGIGLYVKNANDNFFCDHFEVIRFGSGIKSKGCYQPRFTNFRVCWFSDVGVHLQAYDGSAQTSGNGNLFATAKISNLGYSDGMATATGIKIDFGSGEFFRDIDIQATGTSMLIAPPAGSMVRYIWLDNILCDTAAGDGLVLDGTTSEVSNIMASGFWSSNHVYNGVTIKGSKVSGVQFRGGTVRGSQNNGFNIISGSFITIENVMINNNSNGHPFVYPGVYLGANVAQITITNCPIGNLPDQIANLHQGSGIVVEAGTSEALKITGCDLRAYGTGKQPIELKGSLYRCLIANNLPVQSANTNRNVVSYMNFHSYSTVAAGISTFLGLAGVGTLQQCQQTARNGLIQSIVITATNTPGVNQNYVYNLLINDQSISLGSIGNGAFTLTSNVNQVVYATDSVALQVLTSAGAAPAIHKAAIEFTI